MNSQNKEQALATQINALNRDIAPTRDLWSGIELAIEQQQFVERKKSSIVLPVSWAASVVAAVVLSWGVLKPDTEQTLPAAVIAMEQSFQQEKSTMLVSYGEPDLGQLSAEMQQQFTKLANAKKALQTALLAEPDNGDLIELLRWVNQQEIDLIEQLYQPQWQTI